MARIRTIKPEAFASESLASVSLSAERTFFGLLTQADDHGRYRDQAAVIAGLLWSLRPEHGPMGVEDDLNQLDTAGLICRYEGVDGKRYLHVVTFAQHQKVNRPSGVRHPDCPHHDLDLTRESAPPTRGALTEPSAQALGGGKEGSVSHEGAGQNGFLEPSPRTREQAVSTHGPDLGPRNRDLGSTPLGGASAHAPETISAKTLIGEYAAACPNRPPSSFLGHLGKQTAQLLADGIEAAHVRAGLERLRAKGLHPSVLPSLVNEAMNPPTASGTSAGHRPWTNPIDAQSAYGGEL
ncbi:hypothetical protein [Streptomyces sp. NPDC051214]|uniref:hypothetical protein n=1 Tax=Streptomyces sp. NPDC051214 TaxID=3155282 RepID=UPI003422649C